MSIASIHFPLAREDWRDFTSIPVKIRFNPLPSCEGRRIWCIWWSRNSMLQSTSLLRGKTSCGRAKRGRRSRFNPLPSCEGRPSSVISRISSMSLQSTSLLRGKTSSDRKLSPGTFASIHFPLAREDACPFTLTLSRKCFNPLPSCEGRRMTEVHLHLEYCFNPLPSCEGRHAHPALSGIGLSLQSTSLLRGKTLETAYKLIDMLLQSTSLLRGKTISTAPTSSYLSLQSTSLLRGKTPSACLFLCRM